MVAPKKNSIPALMLGFLVLGLGAALAWTQWSKGPNSAAPSPSSTDTSREAPLLEQQILAAEVPLASPGTVPDASGTERSGEQRSSIRPAEDREAEVRQGEEPPLPGLEAQALDDPALATFTLCVVDHAGAPLFEQVTLRTALSVEKNQHLASQWVRVPDEAGCITMKVAPPSGLFDMVVESSLAGEAASALVPSLQVRPGGQLDLGVIRLETPKQRSPIPLASGRLSDDLGRPVVGVRASFEVVGMQIDSWIQEFGSRGEVEIDPDGQFRAYGPAGAQLGSLRLEALGFETMWMTDLPLPALDLRVEMARQFKVTGRLITPEGWPDLGNYGVWGRHGDSATGLKVEEDGSFVALLSARALDFEVTYPRVGFKIFVERLGEPSGELLELGDVHLGQHARRSAFRVLGPDGEPLANEALNVATPEETPRFTFLRTDKDGNFVVLLPVESKQLQIGRKGAEMIALDLVAPVDQIQLP